MSETKEKILLIDSNALVHRAYHAFPKNMYANGTLVNAVYGFTKLLLQVLKEFNPKYVICAFDTHAPTFRHKMFKEYKGTRKKTDDELIAQFPLIHDVLEALNIPVIEQAGLEADDILGTLSKSSELSMLQKVVVTGDKDLLQLITQDTSIYLAGSSFSKSVLYDVDSATKKLGFEPILLIDYKAFRGDPSDNIPGVRGVGDKTATNLIQQFGGFDAIYDHIGEIKESVKKKLEVEKDIAKLSFDLATIKVDADLKFKLADAELKDYDTDKATKLFLDLEFRSLLSRLPNAKTVVTKPIISEQFGLFGQINEETSSIDYIEVKDDTKWQKMIASIQKEPYFTLLVTPIVKNDIFSGITLVTLAVGDTSFVVEYTFFDDKKFDEFIKVGKDKKIITYLAKTQYHYLQNTSLIDINFDFDISIAAHLLSIGKGKRDFDSLIFSTLGVVVPNGLTGKDEMAKNSLLINEAYPKLKKLLNEQHGLKNGWGIAKLFQDMEMPLVKPLMEMERNGIFLDKDYLKEIEKELDTEKARLESLIYDIAGEEFNIASTKQLSEILFGKLKLTGGKKTKSGSYSTNEKILRNLRDASPIIPLLLEYRETSKLRSTYTEALIDLINSKSGKIHTTYMQDIASTGRLASKAPNLQNIPISSENGRKVRSAFKAEKGRKFFFLDYSQQELRLLAHFSKEPKLKSVFDNGGDIHALTAAAIFDKSLDEISKAERKVGKTVNFGVVYGISAYGLSEQLKVSREEAQNFIDKFFDSYPKVRRFFDGLLAEAEKLGYVETMLGRKRSASGLNVSNYQMKMATRREIINFPLQGSAADMMKLAMLSVYDLVNAKYKKHVKIMLQIHDELIFDVDVANMKKVDLERFLIETREAMASVLKLDVPIEVSVEMGDNLTAKSVYNLVALDTE